MPIPEACPMCGSPRREFRVSRSTGRAKCDVCGEVFEPDEEYGGMALEAPRPRRPGGGGGRAADRVQAPAIGLLVVGGLSVLISLGYSGLTTIGAMQGPPPERPNMQPGEAVGQKIGFYGAAIGIPLSLLALTAVMLMGGYQMLNLASWNWSLLGALAAMVPCCNFTFLFGIPIGIWALIVLLDPDVKAAFR